MTEPKFTPGPWTAEEYKHGHGAWVVRSPDGYLIAENMAGQDAALLAAAPDMYDALYSVCVACKMRDHETECKLCTVEAALRKARGESEVEK